MTNRSTKKFGLSLVNCYVNSAIFLAAVSITLQNQCIEKLIFRATTQVEYLSTFSWCDKLRWGRARRAVSSATYFVAALCCKLQEKFASCKSASEKLCKEGRHFPSYYFFKLTHHSHFVLQSFRYYSVYLEVPYRKEWVFGSAVDLKAVVFFLLRIVWLWGKSISQLGPLESKKKIGRNHALRDSLATMFPKNR